MKRRVHITMLRFACWLALAGSIVVSGFSATALTEDRQYKVEAAFLYSFFNYVTWPDYTSPQDLQKPTICVYGEDPLTSYLDYIRHKVKAERALNVRTVTDDSNAEGCHVLFMRHRISQRMLSSLPPTVLTVLKPDDPLDRGGMIELFEDEERISIKINQSLLEQNGFQVSSRLLDLARSVR